MTVVGNSLLDIAENYFLQEVKPQAELIDQEVSYLAAALQRMGELNLLALRISPEYGGGGLTKLEYHQFQLMISRYSGALAFLQTQHQSAASLLAAGTNQKLQQTYLPAMATGKKLVGVGISQLRRPNPNIRAELTQAGYEITGEVPWIAGWQFFSEFIVAAILADGREIYAIAPLTNAEQTEGGKITISPPMQLAAMKTTNTVSAKLQRWRVAEVIAIKPAGTFTKRSKANILHHGFFALGCAQAALDIITTVYQTKQFAFLLTAHQQLNKQLMNCRNQMLEATRKNIPLEKQLNLRATAINLAGRCSQAAVSASSGAANFLTHPAQRVYREALMYTVSGQTLEVMAATLKILASDSEKRFRDE
ncbi:MAG: acyl-CoA dehydrogenase [Cyanobacteria bacterium J083]|nr:MAG: acyl-CoA dehydrogenase [Cyanobacteria bacterium J083]